MPHSRLIIFDLDGTLVDSMEQYTQLFCRLLAERHGLDESFSRTVYESLLGLPPGRQFADALTLAGRDVADVEELTAQFWVAAENHAPSAFPEVLSVLQGLTAAGHALVISSGGRPGIVAYRAHNAGIDGFFALILGTDESVEGMAKGPGHFAILREALGLSHDELRERAVFVGDGVYDMQVAREAGIPAIGRLTGENGDALRREGAEHLIDDLTGLGAVLEQIERDRSVVPAT